MRFCKEVNVEVPDSFPLSAWQDFYAVGVSAVGDELAAEDGGRFREFHLAMTGVMYRFRASREAIDSMVSAWNAAGQESTYEGYYTTERDLSAFFSSAISSVECLCYAAYVLITRRHPTVYGWTSGVKQGKKDERKNVDSARFSGLLAKAYPNGHQLKTEIDIITDHRTWNEWKGYRNTMIHRSIPPRSFEGRTDGVRATNHMVKYGETWCHPALEAGEAEMEERLTWLSNSLQGALAAAATL